MARPKRQYFVLEVAAFRTDVGVCINCTEAEILRYHRNKRRPATPAGYEAIAREIKDWDNNIVTEGRMCPILGGFLVLLRIDPKNVCSGVGTIVHEMTHVTQYLLRDRRVPLNEDTEEVHAYLVEHLVVEALKRWRK